MIRISINKQPITPIPEHFNEFTAEQLLNYFKLLQACNPVDFATYWLRLFISDELLEETPAGKLADLALEVRRIMNLTSKPLTNQFFPELELEGKKLIGVQNALKDMSFGRFVEADEMYWVYLKTKNQKYLHRLIAILYRYSNEREYDNASVLQRAEELAKLDTALQAIIFEFYAGCRVFLTKRFPLVFPASSGKQQELTLKSIKDMKEAFNTVMVDFAKTPDRKPEVYNTNVYTVFEFVQRNIKKNKELETLYAKK